MIRNEKNWVAILDKPIGVMELQDFVFDPRHGASAQFLGLIRNEHHGKKTVAVSYDVYEPLAESLFLQFCELVQGKCGGGLRIALHHRSGRLVVGEISLAIVVSSMHRQQALAACSWLIEKVKHESPIWKKEHFENGDSQWEKGHSLCQHEPSVSF